MARMVSPAGDMDVKMRGIGVNKGEFCIRGQIGVWDSEIYLSREEVFSLAKSIFSPSFVAYVVTLPFAVLAGKLRRKPNQA